MHHAAVRIALLASIVLGAFPATAQEGSLAKCDANDAGCQTRILDQIRTLEERLLDLRQLVATEEPIACHMSESGQFVVTEMAGGYNVTWKNTTAPRDSVTRFNVYLAPSEDSEIVLTDMFIHVFNTETVESKFKLDTSSLESLVQDDRVIDSLIGTLLAIPIFCACIGLTIGLEAKFKCIGGGKLHHLVDEQKKIANGIHELMDLMGVVHKKVERAEEEQLIDDPENPGVKIKPTPLDNPIMKILITKALAHAGVDERKSHVVIHALKKLHTSPSEALDALKESGLVPAHLVEDAKAHAEQAKERVKDEVIKAGEQIREDNPNFEQRVRTTITDGLDRSKVVATGVKEQAIKTADSRGLKIPRQDESMTAPAIPETKAEAKKRLKQARKDAAKALKSRVSQAHSFKAGASGSVSVEYSNPMRSGGGQASTVNPMNDVVVIAEMVDADKPED